jgi:hypothetical protein
MKKYIYIIIVVINSVFGYHVFRHIFFWFFNYRLPYPGLIINDIIEFICNIFLFPILSFICFKFSNQFVIRVVSIFYFFLWILAIVNIFATIE